LSPDILLLLALHLHESDQTPAPPWLRALNAFSGGSMKLRTKLIYSSVAAIGALALVACDEDDHYHHRHHEVVYTEPVYTEPAPVYDYTYYDTGYYNGPYWYYRDRSGHWYHEMREEHERRMRERGRSDFRESHAPAGVERREAHERAEHEEHEHDRR
jgi:hypothetical protein